MVKSFLLLILLFDETICKRNSIFFYKKPDFKFNINYVNASWDFSTLMQGTKEKPNAIIPAVDLELMQDINQLQAQFFVQHLTTNQILMNINMNFCAISSKNAAGFMIRGIFNMLLKAANVTLKCPFKKGTTIHISDMDTGSLPTSPMFFRNIQESATFSLNTGKKSTPFFSVVFYYTRVEVDD